MMDPKSDVAIREMKKSDFVDSAMIMTHAFRSKLVVLKSWSDQQVAELLLMSKLFDEDNLEGFYVAAIEDKVAGIIHLDWFEQQKNRKLPKLNMREIIRVAGLKTVVFSALTLLFFEEKVQKEEVAVETVAVSPEYRGMGIGKSLLSFGEAFARDKKGINKYSLRVIGQNEGALRLYKRFGFKIIQTKKHPILKHLTTVDVHHFMEKVLN